MEELNKIQMAKRELVSDTFRLFHKNQLLKRKLKKLEKEKKISELDNFILKLKLLTN